MQVITAKTSLAVMVSALKLVVLEVADAVGLLLFILLLLILPLLLLLVFLCSSFCRFGGDPFSNWLWLRVAGEVAQTVVPVVLVMVVVDIGLYWLYTK